MPTSPASLGEVARRLDEIFNRYEQIANDLPRTFVSKELFDASKELAAVQQDAIKTLIAAQETRIKQLEDDKTWLYRLVIGAVILAILGIVISSTIAARNVNTSTGQKQSQVVTPK